MSGARSEFRRETPMKHIEQKGRSRGYVLLTVTLVGALLVISALMFVSQLTTESHVTKTDAYFKSALNVAETGLNEMLMGVSQSVGTSTWAQRLQNNSIPSFDAVETSAVHGAYKVTVVRVGASVADPAIPNRYSAEVQVTSEGRLYTSAVTTMVSAGAPSDEYAARRAVRSQTTASWTYVPALPGSPAVWNPPVYGPTTLNIRYGIFTGGNLTIQGSSQEIDGDVWANGNIEIKKASGLVGGDAYAAGTVTGGIPAGDKFPGQTPIPFPEIDIPPLQRLFDAYLRGTFPYDGTVADMTNTSHTPAGEINRALYNVNLLLPPVARVDPVTGLYELPSMVPITSSVRSALIDPTAVYYFDGDMKLASSSALSGTIVIKGDLFISGSVEVGMMDSPVRLIATGDVTKDTGCSHIVGLVYTSTALSSRATAWI
jgi:hypothetical protein